MHISISNDFFSCLPTGQNELDPQNADQVARQTRIQQLDYSFSVCAKVNAQMHHKEVMTWKRGEGKAVAVELFFMVCMCLCVFIEACAAPSRGRERSGAVPVLSYSQN